MHSCGDVSIISDKLQIFRALLGVCDLWAGIDSYLTIPAVTWGVGVCGHVRRTTVVLQFYPVLFTYIFPSEKKFYRRISPRRRTTMDSHWNNGFTHCKSVWYWYCLFWSLKIIMCGGIFLKHYLYIKYYSRQWANLFHNSGRWPGSFLSHDIMSRLSEKLTGKWLL